MPHNVRQLLEMRRQIKALNKRQAELEVPDVCRGDHQAIAGVVERKLELRRKMVRGQRGFRSQIEIP
jgi:hypothetical protein